MFFLAALPVGTFSDHANGRSPERTLAKRPLVPNLHSFSTTPHSSIKWHRPSEADLLIMAEAGESEPSPWAQGEAAFTRYGPIFLVADPRQPNPRLHFGTDRTDSNLSKEYSKFFDPCQEAATRSIKCLHRNGGDRSMCTDYFQ